MNEILVTSESNPVEIRCKSLTLDAPQKFVQDSVPVVSSGSVTTTVPIGLFSWDVPQLVSGAGDTITMYNPLIKVGSVIFLSMGTNASHYILTHAVPTIDGRVGISVDNTRDATVTALTVQVGFMIMEPVV